MSQALRAAASRLESWIKNDALPLWLERGIEPKTNANYERLTPAGLPDLESSTRVRVQARQAFFFAAAYHRGWCEQGKPVAKNLLTFVHNVAAHPTAGGGYTHLLDNNFVVVDTKQDLYDHAFFLLANAWCYRAFNEQSYLDEADKLIAHLDAHFGSAVGGWIEGDYAYACRRQNPHMHLFEAFLALYDATGNAKYLARVGELFALFQSHFFDETHGVLFEFFDDSWTRLPNAKGDTVEPGHMMEWVWLLDWYHRRTGRPVAHYTKALYARGLEIGMDKSGLLFDAVSYTGDVIDRNKRCWGITELIKASLVQIREGNPNAEAIAVKGVDDLFTYYLCASTPGSYVDQRGANDEVVVDVAPASTLYHLIVAAMELLDHVNAAVK
ncbi:mannose-6-phosphate isomerase [Cellvibrio sp. KY-GH-1]|uniref:AGE family epimerase/isomerase n=1 Tax=Cellvibrio sp. KY-GH-1 TaxID=2303332 RepID=UPI0012443828|nr:AGE family epimerase/isomerase [Cellvibrio sp. KY-GH-1]QEY19116.1 mannose-6-phosphate isomerase [Cellvibrio sp. KY-GH-1]